MLTEQERRSIIDFYWQQTNIDDPCLFLLDRSIGYVELGNELGYLYIDLQQLPADIPDRNDTYKVGDLPDAIKLKRPDSSIVPESVIKAFHRHIWYSRYCLTDIRLVTFDVVGCKTFALCIEGYFDGSWWNQLKAWEIYEANGDFVGSLINSDEEWHRKNAVITDEEFDPLMLPPLPPPPYTPELIARSPSPIQIERYDGGWVLPLWSEEEVTIVE